MQCKTVPARLLGAGDWWTFGAVPPAATLNRPWISIYALTIGNGVDELPDTDDDEISDELADFGERQQREAEPQTEHTTEIRDILDRLYTPRLNKLNYCQ